MLKVFWLKKLHCCSLKVSVPIRECGPQIPIENMVLWRSTKACPQTGSWSYTCTILRSQQFLLGGDAALCQITLTTCYHWFYNLPQWFDSPNLYWQCVSSTCSVVILLRPSYIGERSIVMSVSVFVCLSASIYPVTACLIFTKSVCMLHMCQAHTWTK